MSKKEALRRQGERTAPIQPQSPPSQEKREALGQLANERTDAVLDQLQQDTGERMRNRGSEDGNAGLPGTVATAGNEANIGQTDQPGGGANPQT